MLILLEKIKLRKIRKIREFYLKRQMILIECKVSKRVVKQYRNNHILDSNDNNKTTLRIIGDCK